MKGWIIGIALAAVATYAGLRVASIVVAKSSLTQRADRDLDQVDDRSIEAVRQDLVKEAKRLGVELKPADVVIIYEDTEHLTYPQRVVSGVVQVTNKRVEIRARYEASIFGISWPQEVSVSKIKVIQVKRASPGREYDELLK